MYWQVLTLAKFPGPSTFLDRVFHWNKTTCSFFEFSQEAWQLIDSECSKTSPTVFETSCEIVEETEAPANPMPASIEVVIATPSVFVSDFESLLEADF